MRPVLLLARALGAGRIAFGAGIVITPRLTAAVWIGPRRAARPEAAVLGRALGARDAALGAATLSAFASKDPNLIRAAMAACVLSDGTDLLATLAARRHLPPGPAWFSALAAGASTMVALTALATTRTPDADAATRTGASSVDAGDVRRRGQPPATSATSVARAPRASSDDSAAR
jgi:hypothetical protein